ERLLAVNLVAGEDHHPANRVTDRLKRLDLRSWERRQYRLHREISLEGGDDRVTGQPVLTQRRTVVQVPIGSDGVEVKPRPVRQRFAPQDLVVAAQRRAVRVRILA